MADELERLQAIRSHRLTRAESALRQSERVLRQQERALEEAARAERAYRAALPQKLQAAFAPILRQPVRLTPIAQARQREADLRAQAEQFTATRRSAAQSVEEAQAETATRRRAVQLAVRKQEALNLLRQQQDGLARRAAERKAAEQLDEFAEQAYWREG